MDFYDYSDDKSNAKLKMLYSINVKLKLKN